MEYRGVSLAYGDGQVRVDVPTSNLLGIYHPRVSIPIRDERSVVRQSLDNPIGTPRLRQLARPGQKVAIVTSDLTRPCPSKRLLAPLIEELAAAGVPYSDITVVFALGLHRPMTSREMAAAAGSGVSRRVALVNHDPTDTVAVGATSWGTRVELFRPVVEADVRVCVGSLEFHYFAGYSGGVKAILPGCASQATVTANHAMMVQPGAKAGRIDGNPVRSDIEEGAALLGVDFIVNVVTGEDGRILAAFAGDATAAHRRGCALVAACGYVRIPRPADIVIASAGGYPKDVNLYQAQKALDNAAHAVRDGGTVVLVAECREGLGNSTFEAWMREARTPKELILRIQREFELGGHKAAAIAAVETRASVCLVSDLSEEIARVCGMRPYASLNAALSAALQEAGTDANIVILPQAGSILPVVPPA